ncbi:centrosomal protein of 112 kDa isoform X1 [Paramormyrops kingsleyae]|uniref:centrosomal protein of 112 kDa isoform X2 n=1 Tax=Paramormyrops kingsleyae TaxID=1676925 RepID=UPI003B978973
MSRLVENTYEKLDSEFDHHLVDVKPYVLKLPHKSDRQRCALWIKKLCDPLLIGSGTTGRKNRNMYAKLLLHMLKRGLLEGPFTHKPEPGALKTLPTYMSIYFDEPLRGESQEQSVTELPSWVSGELGLTDSPWTFQAKERPLPSTSSPRPHRRRHTCGDKLTSRTQATATPLHTSNGEERRSHGHRNPGVSSDDSDLEARLNSWNLGIENPRYLRETPIPLSPIYLKSSLGKNGTFCDDTPRSHTHEREADMKAKMLEVYHQEEKLKMQQKHDSDVQKILDRKNGEIEELKTMYRSKLKDSEEMIHKLEKKVQSLVQESQVIRQSKEKQIAELKKMSEQSVESLRNELEKKLHASVAELEQEKIELQKKHTQSIQELLEDTNQRLAKMECEYGVQMQATEKVAKELEARVKQLSIEVEHSNSLRQRVAQEKVELELQVAAIKSELQETNRRCAAVVHDKEELSKRHAQSLQEVQAQHDSALRRCQQEKLLSSAKASKVTEELEQCVIRLRDSEQARQARQEQLRDQENAFLQEKSDFQQASEKKVQSLKCEMEREVVEAKKKISKLEDAVREKEEQLLQVWERQRQQALQAEEALEQLKRQAELSSEKAYADMRQQMEEVEADLGRCRALREKQAGEFACQQEELKQRYDSQIAELKLQREQERTHLFQQHNGEKDSLVQDHQREMADLQERSKAAILQREAQTLELRKRDSENLMALETQVQTLREELRQAHAQRKQQLLELGLQREEERKRAARDMEAVLSRLRAEADRVHLDLERTHAAGKELAAEKNNSRLKQMEKEFSLKLSKSAQVITDLQVSLHAAREESRQLRQEAESRWEAERQMLTRNADINSKVLQEKVENLQRQVHAVEKQLISKELEMQQQVTQVRQECELKIKGLMPASLRRELDGTITSLRSQVGFLQKRAALQQQELEAYRSRR